MPGPSAEICAQVHSEMFADRKGESLDVVLSKMAGEGFYKAADIIEHHGYHWLRLKEPAGRNCDKIAITTLEARERKG